MKTIFILFIALGFALPLSAGQSQTQEIRGKIIDKDTLRPIEGATISLNDSKLTVGTLSDENGDFKLWDVPLSVKSLRVSASGYKNATIQLDKRNDSDDNRLIIKLESKEPEKKKILSGIWQKRNKQEYDFSQPLAIE